MVEIDSDIDSQKARRDQLVNDWLDAKAAADKYKQMLEQLNEQLIRELGVGGRHEVLPGVGVRVQAPAMKFNAAKAREELTEAQYLSICVPTPSVALADLNLPGVLREKCKVPNAKPSVMSL